MIVLFHPKHTGHPLTGTELALPINMFGCLKPMMGMVEAHKTHRLRRFEQRLYLTCNQCLRNLLLTLRRHLVDRLDHSEHFHMCCMRFATTS